MKRASRSLVPAPVKKFQPSPPPPPSLSTISGAIPYSPSGPTTHYKQFLDRYVVGRPPSLVTQPQVDNWLDVDTTTPAGQIYDEFAKKFINTNRLGIGNVEKVPSHRDYQYGMNSDPTINSTYLNLKEEPYSDSTGTVKNSPFPKSVAHELAHANDHQVDNLNAKTWPHLENLYNDLKISRNSNKFRESIKRIQDVIDPSKTFSTQYPLKRPGMVTDINTWKDYINNPRLGHAPGSGIGLFTPPLWSNKKTLPMPDNWTTTFNEINPVVTDIDPATGIENKPFFLNQPTSEFIAHAAERLHEPWGMGKNIPNPNNPGSKILNPNRFIPNPNSHIVNPKSYKIDPTTGTYILDNTGLGTHIKDPNRSRSYERNFVSSILGDMNTAYPSTDYPNINHYINERQQEINYKTGGHVKNYAGGGYVSSNSSYDPYLNTYNYEAPLRLSEYLTDQMPESGYDETGGYNDPYMSYGNAYDTTGAQYAFKEGGAVERGNSNFPRLLDVIGEEETVRGDIVNKAKELSQMVINEVLNANNGKLDESALIQGFAEISNSLNLNEVEKNQVERFVENIFKNSQFNDSPGYFYEKAHGMTNNMPTQSSFKRGGSVGDEDLPKLVDLIRRHGRNGDTELAHINPIEAHILKSLGGSGTINPKTGLREYSFWSNPGKATRSFFSKPKRALAETLAIGSAIFGGPAGSAAGHAAKEAILGRKPKDILMGALKGAGYGTAVPMAANLAGQGLSALGANGLGSSLQNYATSNMGSWFGNMAQAGQGVRGLGLPFTGGNSGSSSLNLFDTGGSNWFNNSSPLTSTILGGGRGQSPGLGVSAGDSVNNRGFFDKLGDNFSDYLSKPSNLLTLGTTAAQYLGREKPKSPEQIGNEERRRRNASRKTIAEVEAEEALEIARKDLKKKHKNKQLEEDIKNMGSARRHVVSPEEFARTGRWLEYEDDEGRPIRMKGGGLMRSPYDYLVEEVSYPTASPLHYLNGDSGGQDDLIDAKLSDGEYVIDAATVADLGDGNNAAGARKLDNFRRNIREHKRGGKITLPPRAKSLQSYLMG